MTDEIKEKLRNRILSGQSLKMICWEFKMKKQNVLEFAKQENLILRTKDELRYTAKVAKKFIG
jgi:hypothetical protein